MFVQVSEIPTPLHKLPTGLKFGALLALTILFVLIENLLLQLIFFTGQLICARALGQMFFRAWLQNLRPLAFFIAVILLWHLWQGKIAWGLVIVFRLMNAVGAANFFSMTTRLDKLLSLLMRLVGPLRILGVQPKILAMSVALTMRFIPILRQKSNRLQESWRARSTKRASWRIVVPMTLLALDDAGQISDALRARGGITPEKDI